MSNHTPGPWTRPHEDSFEVITNSGGRVASTAVSAVPHARAANARLIASSPKMYAFIQRVAQGGYTPFEMDAQALLTEIAEGD